MKRAIGIGMALVALWSGAAFAVGMLAEGAEPPACLRFACRERADGLAGRQLVRRDRARHRR